tara:strand:+ start:66 stop:632 length:567 start_codon:yes stop_codon:yes gene_type:complete
MFDWEKFLKELESKIYDSGLRATNFGLLCLDFHLAKQLREALIDLKKNDDQYKTKKFFFEGIFLDLTDQTQSHPIINVKRKTISKESTLFSPLGQEEIVWELTEDFDLEKYFNDNWFVKSLDLNLEKKKELENSKKLYKESEINFFEYFRKRIEIYQIIKPSEFEKFYKGVKLDVYQSNLRKVFEMVL